MNLKVYVNLFNLNYAKAIEFVFSQSRNFSWDGCFLRGNTLLKNNAYILFLFNKSELLEVLLISSVLKNFNKKGSHNCKNCAQFQQLKVLNRVKLRKFVSWKKIYKCAVLKWFEKYFKKFDMVLVNTFQSYEQPFKQFLVPDKLFRTWSNLNISKKFIRCSNLFKKLAVFLRLRGTL